MRYYLKVKTKAKQNSVIYLDKENLLVQVTEVPIKGKANKVIIDILADYFHLSKSKIMIVGGGKSKKKIIEVVK